MHETSVALQILELVLEEAKKENLTQVAQVNIEYGDLSGIHPECIEQSVNLLTEERFKPLVNTQFVFNEVPGTEVKISGITFI